MPGSSRESGIVLREESAVAYEYVLGLLNSRVVDFYLRSLSSPFRGAYFAYSRQYIERMPIPLPKSTHERRRHDEIVERVREILRLYRDLGQARTACERDAVEREIAAVDAAIDGLASDVFGLFGLRDH